MILSDLILYTHAFNYIIICVCVTYLTIHKQILSCCDMLDTLQLLDLLFDSKEVVDESWFLHAEVVWQDLVVVVGQGYNKGLWTII